MLALLHFEHTHDASRRSSSSAPATAFLSIKAFAWLILFIFDPVGTTEANDTWFLLGTFFAIFVMGLLMFGVAVAAAAAAPTPSYRLAECLRDAPFEPVGGDDA